MSVFLFPVSYRIYEHENVISFHFYYFFIDAKKICFSKYGCFSINKYFQVKHAALPSHPNVIQTKFFLHTRRNPKSAEELNLRLHYMMKTLISSVFTFLLIYIQGLEISRLPQVFFKNIKMRPKYNKKCYNH